MMSRNDVLQLVRATGTDQRKRRSRPDLATSMGRRDGVKDGRGHYSTIRYELLVQTKEKGH